MLKGGRPMSTVNNDYLFSGQIETLHEQIKNLNLENKKMDSKLKGKFTLPFFSFYCIDKNENYLQKRN